jgi:hypothetical protein
MIGDQIPSSADGRWSITVEQITRLNQEDSDWSRELEEADLMHWYPSALNAENGLHSGEYVLAQQVWAELASLRARLEARYAEWYSTLPTDEDCILTERRVRAVASHLQTYWENEEHELVANVYVAMCRELLNCEPGDAKHEEMVKAERTVSHLNEMRRITNSVYERIRARELAEQSVEGERA